MYQDDVMDELSDDLPLDNALEQFRSQWVEELKEKRPLLMNAASGKSSAAGPRPVDSLYTEAKDLFLCGVCAEQNGFMFEAIDYYRRATRLVPDIELQIGLLSRPPQAGQETAEETLQEHPCEIEDLCGHFTDMLLSERVSRCCLEDHPQRATHISALPAEIMAYIFRWVVSSDLDTRSLEQLSMVCRGFYLCARDPRLWQSVCQRRWGVGCETYFPHLSWRHMCIEKPHVLCNGIYMCKVEFMRQGEATLDKFYPPWQKVTYYRYLRFFPDGLLLMHTSSSEPTSMVGYFRKRDAHLQGMCRGLYRMKGHNGISCILKRVKPKEKRVYSKHQRQLQEIEAETTFYAEFTLDSYASKSNTLLKWEKYTCNVYYPATNEECSSEFHLSKQDYPACRFARVKSYTIESLSPL